MDQEQRQKQNFLELCQKNDLKAVKQAFSENSVRIAQGDIDDALFMATGYGSLEVAKYLIEEHGADVHTRSGEPLYCAAFGGHLRVVKYLVEECGVTPSDRDYVFEAAADQGHLDVVKYFVENGLADPYKNIEAFIPCALAGERLDVIKYLIKNCYINIPDALVFIMASSMDVFDQEGRAKKILDNPKFVTDEYVSLVAKNETSAEVIKFIATELNDIKEQNHQKQTQLFSENFKRVQNQTQSTPRPRRRPEP